MKEILVLAEHVDNKLSPITFELLGAARSLADKLQARVACFLLGYNIKDQIQALFSAGADRVYIAEHPELKDYRTLPYNKIISDYISSLEIKPHIFLIGATTTGRDLAPRLACKFNSGLTADCTELDIGEFDYNSKTDIKRSGLYKDCLYAIRPSFGESLKARILGPWNNPQMATIRPGIMLPIKPIENKQGEIIEVPINLTKNDLEIEIIESFREINNEIDLSSAEIIIEGGYGLANAQGFDLLRELAGCFNNASLGATRKVIDEGWMPYKYQIGQTGKTVRPKLLIACGVSGAIQQRIGIQNAGCIVAINKDACAPIFRFAHYGIIGDLYHVIPELIKELKEF